MRYANWAFAIALILAWAWMLGRPFILHLLNSAQRDPVGHFNRQLSALGDAPRQSVNQLNAGPYGQVTGVSSTRKRRLQWFLSLSIAVTISIPLALIFQGTFIGVAVMMVAALGVFVLIAARAGAAEVERGQKVRYLAPVESAPVESSGSVYVRAVGER